MRNTPNPAQVAFCFRVFRVFRGFKHLGFGSSWLDDFGIRSSALLKTWFHPACSAPTVAQVSPERT